MSPLNFVLISLLISFTKCKPDLLSSFLYSANISDNIFQNTCPPFGPVANANVEIKSHMGSIAVMITCRKNYSLIGRNIILCINGAWGLGFDELPKCVKRCPPPPYLEHGEVFLEKLFEDDFSPTGSYLNGTIARYTCNEEYTLEPSSSDVRACENGHWTGFDAFCKSKTEMSCGSPPIIKNGFMQPTFPMDYSLVAVGQLIEYRCALGFTLVGSAKIRCTDQGVWIPGAPSCRKDAGQTINDRLLAAKHSIAGQGLAKSVCKATTEEMSGPKKKHLDYLVHCTNEPNVSIPQMANLLIERSQNTSWVVVFKSLITTHHLMCYGNERFTQYLASSNVSFQLSNFVDKTGVQSAVGARTGYDMSPFIRRYAKYLNEKALSYRAVAFDFCKVKRGKEEGTLRTMDAENLLKTLPILQNQLDALLEFDCTANDLTNGVINMCFMLLFRDLIRIFACYNDGIINLLEKYFELNKKQCREALDLYKKFLIRMDRVGEFLKVAENIGIDKGDIPDLTRAPNSLLDALEQHLASLEGNTPTAAANHKNLKSGVSALSNTSSAFGSALDDNFKQAAVAEEEAVFNQYRANIGSPSLASTNPFLSEEPQLQVLKSEPILDLFGDDTLTSVPSSTGPTQNNAIDDLLSLGGNPFADFSTPAPAAAPVSNGVPDFFAAQPAAHPATNNQNMWGNNANSANAFQAPVQQQQPSQQPFNDLTGLFNTNEPSVFDPLASVDQKQTATVHSQPSMPPQRPPQPSKLLTGDLETSLNSLVENLTMDSGSGKWNSPKNQPKTSSAGGWQPQPMAATTAASYRPMMGAQQPAMMGQQPVMQPMMGAPMQYPMGTMQQPQMMGSPKMAVPAAQPQQQTTFDPFGAL